MIKKKQNKINKSGETVGVVNAGWTLMRDSDINAVVAATQWVMSGSLPVVPPDHRKSLPTSDTPLFRLYFSITLVCKPEA